jgi:hypothetical protein
MGVAADQEVMAAAGAGEHGRSPAFTSLRRSALAREFYDPSVLAKEPAAAMHSATSSRWSGTASPNGVPDHGTDHLANRNRTQAAVTSASGLTLPSRLITSPEISRRRRSLAAPDIGTDPLAKPALGLGVPRPGSLRRV